MPVYGTSMPHSGFHAVPESMLHPLRYETLLYRNFPLLESWVGFKEDEFVSVEEGGEEAHFLFGGISGERGEEMGVYHQAKFWWEVEQGWVW